MTAHELIQTLQTLDGKLQVEDEKNRPIRVVREGTSHSMFNGETEERKFVLISSDEKYQIEFKA